MARNKLLAVPPANQRIGSLSLRLAPNENGTNGGDVAFAGAVGAGTAVYGSGVGPHMEASIGGAQDWVILGRFAALWNFDCFHWNIGTLAGGDRFFVKLTASTRALSFTMKRGGANIGVCTITPTAGQLLTDGSELSYMIWKTGNTIGLACIDVAAISGGLPADTLLTSTADISGATANQRSFAHLLDSVNGSAFYLGCLDSSNVNIASGGAAEFVGPVTFCRVPASSSFANFPLSTAAQKMELMRNPQKVYELRSSDTVPKAFDAITSYGQYQRASGTAVDPVAVLHPLTDDKVVAVGIGADVGGALVAITQSGGNISGLSGLSLSRVKIYPDYTPCGKTPMLPAPSQYTPHFLYTEDGAAIVVSNFSYDAGSDLVTSSGACTKNPWCYIGVIDPVTGRFCRPMFPIHGAFAKMVKSTGAATIHNTFYNSFVDWDNHTGMCLSLDDDAITAFITGHGSTVNGSNWSSGGAGPNGIDVKDADGTTGFHASNYHWEVWGFSRLQDDTAGGVWQSIDKLDGTGIAPWGTALVLFNASFTGDLGNESMYRQLLASYGCGTRIGQFFVGQGRSRDTTAGRVFAFQSSRANATGALADRCVITDIGPTWQGPLPIGVVKLSPTKALLLNTVRYDGDSGYLGTIGHILSVGANFGNPAFSWAPRTGEPLDGSGTNALVMGNRFNFSGQNGTYTHAAKTIGFAGTPLTGYTPKVGDTLFITSGTNMTTGYTSATVVSVSGNNTFTMSATCGSADSANVVVSGIFGNLKDYVVPSLLDDDNISGGVLLTKDLCYSVYGTGASLRSDGQGKFLYCYSKAKYADVRDLRWGTVKAEIGIKTFSFDDKTNIVTQIARTNITSLITGMPGVRITYLAGTAQTGNPYAGEVMRGNTSGATGNFVWADHNGTPVYWMQLTNVVGTFTAGETISAHGAAGDDINSSGATFTAANPTNQEAVHEALASENTVQCDWCETGAPEMVLLAVGSAGSWVYTANPQVNALTNQAVAKTITWKGRFGNALYGWYTPNVFTNPVVWYPLNSGAAIYTAPDGATPFTIQRLGDATQNCLDRVAVEFTNDMQAADLASTTIRVIDITTHIRAAKVLASGGGSQLNRGRFGL